jgi:hypothetical protein
MYVDPMDREFLRDMLEILGLTFGVAWRLLWFLAQVVFWIALVIGGVAYLVGMLLGIW